MLIYDSKSVDINVIETIHPRGIFFNSNGTKMYVVTKNTAHYSNNYIYQYSLSTPWDVSTATYDSVSIIEGDTNAYGLFFKSDGTKMFMVGNYNIMVFAWNLSTPWDLSTASTTNGKGVSAQDNNPFGLFFNPTGTKMYVIGYNGGKVYQYSLSTGWDLTTATYSKSYTVSGEDNSPYGLSLTSDGSIMYIVGRQYGKVYKYSLSTPWDVSTASYIISYSVSSEDIDPCCIFLKSDNIKVYISGEQNDKVYQYYFGKVTPTTAPTITTKDNACKDRQSTTLTATGNITVTGGNVDYRGFEYYEKGAIDEYDSSMWAVREMGEFTSTGEFEMTLNGLKPLTVYYIRAFAGNVLGIAYGDWVLCTTTKVSSYDIYESESSPTICFYLSEDDGRTWGLKHGPYTTDQADIEITKLLVQGSGKKKIKFTTDALTGISASVMCKLDIKTR